MWCPSLIFKRTLQVLLVCLIACQSDETQSTNGESENRLQGDTLIASNMPDALASDDEADRFSDAGTNDHHDDFNFADMMLNTPADARLGGDLPTAQSGTGFAEQYQRWSVPQSGSEDGFFSLGWANGTRWFSIFDINGDGRSDIVQTASDQRANGFVWTDAGGAFWKVWLGKPNGFDDTYLRWSVPDSGLADGFFFTAWNDGPRWFGVRDLNGDSIPDLIQTADSTREGGFVWQDTEGAYWKVWLGRAEGFAPDWIRWSVPQNGLNDGFFTLQWANGNRWFTVIDLDGDLKPELVQTAESDREGGYVFEDQNGAYWRVWQNHGHGFEMNDNRWQVPDSGLADGFFFPYWTMGERTFSVLDMNGDRQLDLVQTADSDRSGGHVWQDSQGPYWRVWLGTGDGFATTWTRWSVPESGLDDGFFATWYLNGQRSFGTLDMTGDGIPDLVQTADSARSGGHIWRDEVGTYWKVWAGTAEGFKRNVLRWSVPESGHSDGFYTTHSASGERWFGIMDINGDGVPDLLQTGDTHRDGGFVWQDANGPYWKVWFGE
ncbi:MAG: hypothetical protein ACPGQS_01060 [Bradymonadia bacterium]